MVEFCCNDEFYALTRKYNCQTCQIAKEETPFTFETPLWIAGVAVKNDDTDLDESSESSLAVNTSFTDPSFFKSSESLADENYTPISVDSDNEEERGQDTSLTSTTMLKLMLKRESSIRSALEFAKEHQDSNIGLLKYFSQGTKEEMDAYWKRVEERTVVDRERQHFDKKSVDMDKKQYERELARVRQQRKRERIKEKEIKEGVRSPGGKKCKVN